MRLPRQERGPEAGRRSFVRGALQSVRMFTRPALCGLILGTLILAIVSLGGCKLNEAEPEEDRATPPPRAEVRWDQLDPIQRCIYQRAPEGAEWSFQVIQALCEDGFWPVLTAADLKRMIDAKDWPALEALYGNHLKRHLAREEPEYLLYRALEPIGWESGAEADRYLRRWVSARPKDAFARAARGAQLLSAAREARGDGHREKLSDSRIGLVAGKARQANAQLRRAVALRADLIPAYALLIESYALGGDAASVDLALGTALTQAPWSYYVPARALDYGNEARGVSGKRLSTVLTHSRQFARENPRMALLEAYRAFHDGERQYNFGSYKRALHTLEAAIATAPLRIALLRSARCAGRLEQYGDAMAYYDQLVRFGVAPGEALVGRGLAWEHLGDPRKALSDYKAAQLYLPDHRELRERVALLEKSFKAAKADAKPGGA